MNELKLIEESYELMRKNLDIRFKPLPFCPALTNEKLEDYRKYIEENQVKYALELKALELQYQKDIENFEMRESEKLSQMSDRELLEEIYKKLNRI